jgi:serine/threonine protein kinase
VTRVLDVGELDNGAAYIVMEYLEGEDLAHVLARRGPLSCAEAVGHVIEASEAVAEAHSLGIIHRDLKPANLFLANRTNGQPIVKVLDFGLSKISEGDEHVTSESSILGSPLYMSPEQLFSAHTVDARSDIWSLGVTLYELLTARQAFQGDRMPKVIAAILHGREEPLELVRADIPAGLRAVVHQCLEKDPSKRFADIAHFARGLAPFGPPSGQATVDRISHLLGRARTTPPPPAHEAVTPAPLPEANAKEAGTAPGTRVPGESLPGASRSVTLPSSDPPVASGGTPRARKGTRAGRVIGSLAVVATAAIVIVASRTTTRSGDAPVSTSTGLGPSRSAAGALVDPDHSRPPEDPRVLAPPIAALSASSPPPAPTFASTRPPLPTNAVLQKGTNVPRVATASPRPAAAPSATSSAAPPPSAAVDPLAKLRRL